MTSSSDSQRPSRTKVHRPEGPLAFPCAATLVPALTRVDGPQQAPTRAMSSAPEPAAATDSLPTPDAAPERELVYSAHREAPAPASFVAAQPPPAPHAPPPSAVAARPTVRRISQPSLTILAGAEALAELREVGLRPERVRAFVGASGGPKWLALHGLDRALFPWLLARARAPLHAVGSSIGSWRIATLATRQPLRALESLCDEYIEQRYGKKPSPREISAGGERILGATLGPDGVAPLVEHPLLRLHVVTARMRGMAAAEGALQQLGLGAAIALNALDRRALGLSLERVVFDAGGDPGPFAPWQGLPTTHVPLTKRNALSALYASAAIPAVMQGVRDPDGAPRGTYRDGGVADYHFGQEIDAVDGLTLYPHFYPHLVPGWFDKMLPWRRTRGLKRTILIAPSAEHVASLPHGKIPDRDDFVTMSDRERISAWREVIARGRAMGDELMELLDSGRIAEAAQPLP